MTYTFLSDNSYTLPEKPYVYSNAEHVSFKTHERFSFPLRGEPSNPIKMTYRYTRLQCIIKLTYLFLAMKPLQPSDNKMTSSHILKMIDE